MSREIERKFLVRKDRLPSLREGKRFVQGYLSDHPQVRFRIVDDRRVTLCVKREIGPGERIELEFRRDDLSEA